ncbi:hypothetical protein FHT00_000850 [Sphingomonas insulae]|uniref:Uncharacterized protein n=1 Tax=Sphingomonas insulae TaxID=424800 RepID=A0ABN1HSR2_9SPHN|nr:hypothetical protein [Sphingomonas insulae]NIJ28917.1 hypothetical protein [Sphingomonas insulae]
MNLLTRALRLMDHEGLSHVAVRIAMAIDDLAGNRVCLDRPTLN